eukprot:scaffold53066_cov21-Prasinocladus_malaysianus.AAC.3
MILIVVFQTIFNDQLSGKSHNQTKKFPLSGDRRRSIPLATGARLASQRKNILFQMYGVRACSSIIYPHRHQPSKCYAVVYFSPVSDHRILSPDCAPKPTHEVWLMTDFNAKARISL